MALTELTFCRTVPHFCHADRTCTSQDEVRNIYVVLCTRKETRQEIKMMSLGSIIFHHILMVVLKALILITFSYTHFLSIILFVSFRTFLTGWGVVTVITGAFIFGQSTTIAVMELMHKF